MKINIGEGYYEEMYKQYSYTCKIYGNVPLLSYVEFKNNYPMCVFLTQKQDREVFSAGATINLYVTKSTATEYNWTVVFSSSSLRPYSHAIVGSATRTIFHQCFRSCASFSLISISCMSFLS